MTDLNQFIRWQAEKPRRSVSINIDTRLMSDRIDIRIWVYDYNLQCGQHVSCVAEIDLEAVKEKQDKEELAKLKAKYEELGQQIADRG